MANNIKGITIEIGGDTTKLDKALNGTNKNIRGTQSELKEVNRLLKLDPKNTELAAQKQTLLKNAVSETKEKLDILKTAEKQVQEQFQKGEATEEQYRAIQREIIATEQNLESLEKEAKQSNATLEKVGNAFGTIGEKSTELGKKMMPVTTAIAGIGGASLVAASNFEDAMAKVSTIADTTQVPMEELEKQIMALSDQTGISATDIADNVYNAISSGQKTGDAVNFVSNATKLAKAGFADSGSALDVLTTAMNAYGMEASEVNKVSDMLIQTQNLGKTTVGELSSAMGKVIPTANANNVQMDQLCASYAILTSNGIATAESTTYLNSMLNELGKGGTNVDKVLREETGKSFSQLSEEGKSLSDILNIIKQSADENGKSFSDMWSSSEAAKAGIVLLGDSADGFNDTLSKMQNSTGATDEAFEKLDTTSNTAKISINQVKNAGIELGTSILSMLQPTIEKVVGKIKEFTEWFKNLSDSQKETIIKIALLVAAIGPALMIFGKMSTGISGVIKIVGGLTTKLISMSKIIIALTGPVGIVIGVIAALVAGFIALYKTSDEFKAKVDEIVEKIKNAIDLVKNILQAWVSFTINFLEGFGTNVKQIFTNIWNEIVAIFQGVGQWFFDRFTEAYTAITTIFSAIGGWFAARWQDIKNALATVATWFLTMFTNAYTNATNVFSVIGGWFAARWQDIKNSLATVATWFLTMFTNAYTNATNVFSIIGGWFAARWQDIKNALATVPEWFKTQFDSAWTNIKNAFANVTSFFSELWEKIKNCFVNVGTAIGSAVGDAFKSAINSCLSTIEGVVNKFIKMINGVIGIINDIPGVSLSKIDALSLPRLAKGGVLKEGTAMVAEAGPELLSMVNGKAVVTPLTGSAANTATDALKGNYSGFSQQINITSPKALSAYEIARQTRIQTRRAALAIVRG